MPIVNARTHNARLVDDLKNVIWEAARRNEATIGDLSGPHRVSNSAQLVRPIALCLVGESGVHGAPHGRPDSIASYEEVACRRGAIREGQYDRLSDAGTLDVAFEALGEMKDPVRRVEVFDEDLLDV